MLVSAFAFGGVPERAVAAVLADGIPCLSYELLEEYRDVPRDLRDVGKISQEQWQSLIGGIAAFAVLARVTPAQETRVFCRDQADVMVLECCRGAKAEVLITGDRDLLELDRKELREGGLGRLRIVRPRAYLSSR